MAATGSIAGGMPVATVPGRDLLACGGFASACHQIILRRVVQEKPSSSEPGLCYQIVPTIRHSDCIGVWQPVPDYWLGAL